VSIERFSVSDWEVAGGAVRPDAVFTGYTAEIVDRDSLSAFLCTAFPVLGNINLALCQRISRAAFMSGDLINCYWLFLLSWEIVAFVRFMSRTYLVPELFSWIVVFD
jgi:hypothetical protein